MSYVAEAKQILQQPLFDKLVFVDQFIKSKRSLSNLLWAVQAVSRAGLYQAVNKSVPGGDQAITRHWRGILAAASQAQDVLSSHPQPKLLLTNLVMSL